MTLSHGAQILAGDVIKPSEEVTVEDILEVFGEVPRDKLPSIVEKAEMGK